MRYIQESAVRNRTMVGDCINKGSASFETAGQSHATKLEKQAEQEANQTGRQPARKRKAKRASDSVIESRHSAGSCSAANAQPAGETSPAASTHGEAWEDRTQPEDRRIFPCCAHGHSIPHDPLGRDRMVEKSRI